MPYAPYLAPRTATTHRPRPNICRCKVLECNPGLETGSAKTLFTYEPPVSPHLCGDRPTDEELVRAVLETMVSTMGEALDARNGRGLHAVVETFGGPGSPMPSRTMQVDALRPLFLPAMLVGDAKLGGISTTLSSYEMIKSRGYPVRGVCMLHDARLRNHEVVQRHVDEEVIVLDPPEDDGPLRGAFLDQEGWRALFDVCFGPEHEAPDQDIDGKKARARDRIWWPFTQHAALGDGAVDYISHRSLGDHIVTDDAVLFDASASWWTQVRAVVCWFFDLYSFIRWFAHSLVRSFVGSFVPERTIERSPGQWFWRRPSPAGSRDATSKYLYLTPITNVHVEHHQGMSAELMPGLSAAVGRCGPRAGCSPLL